MQKILIVALFMAMLSACATSTPVEEDDNAYQMTADDKEIKLLLNGMT